jgi:hypothetical protein
MSDRYHPADLSPVELETLKKTEETLRSMTGREIVLIAYQEADGDGGTPAVRQP